MPLAITSGAAWRCAWVAVLASAPGWSQSPAAPVRAPEVRLRGDRVVLPFVMGREFPFVDASVAGVDGKLMLDTGIEAALTINDHRVPLPAGQSIGAGQYGSGQSFNRRLNPLVRDVRVGSMRFARVTDVASHDAHELESVAPDFLGWLGYRFWQGYALKLDYRRERATFYQGGAGDYLAGEKLVAVLPFAVRKLPNTPLIAVAPAGVDAVVSFDSGQYGGIYTNAGDKARLMAAGILRPEAGGTFTLSGLTVAGHAAPAITGMKVSLDPYPGAGPIGIDEPTFISLGYGFLRHYKTVWDLKERRLHLLKR